MSRPGEDTFDSAGEQALTTHFFSKDLPAGQDTSTPLKTKTRPEHTSLLVTPLNRATGGRVHAPSPSILDKYFGARQQHQQQQQQSSPALQSRLAGSLAMTPPQSLPGSRTSSVMRPSQSPQLGTADIRARLQNLSRSPLGTSHHTPVDRTSPGATSSEFSISAVRSAGSAHASGESIAARSRANQLQAELEIKGMEVQRLAEAASDARRQRDTLQAQVESLAREAHEARAACARAEAERTRALRVAEEQHRAVYQQQQRAVLNTGTGSDLQRQVDSLAATVALRDEMIAGMEALQCANSKTDVNIKSVNHSTMLQTTSCRAPRGESTEVPSTTTIQAALAKEVEEEAAKEAHKQTEALRRQAEMATAQVHGLRAQATGAEDRARMAEAKCSALEAARVEAETSLQRLKSQYSSLQSEVRRMAADLAAAEDRAALAEATLAEERARGHGRGGGAQRAANSEAVALAEAALTAQVRSLAAQLQAAKGDAAAARQEVASLRGAAEGRSTAQEGATASLLSANRELEAALGQVAQDLQSRIAELEDARATISTLSSENASLHAALNQRGGEAAHQAAVAADGHARADALESQIAALQRELHIAHSKAAQMEDAMSRTGGMGGPSPLRDVVGTLRSELQDRELRLAAAEEELAGERRRAAELHRQVLDQAVELDDLQAEHAQHGSLRGQIAAARQRAEAAEAELAACAAGTDALRAAREEAVRVEEENAALRHELETREAEVMQLQGQLNMLGGQETDVANWLMDLPEA